MKRIEKVIKRLNISSHDEDNEKNIKANALTH